MPSNVFWNPITGNKINPATSDPATPPKVLIKYNSPIPVPNRAMLGRASLTQKGKIMPIKKVAGKITKKIKNA